MNKPKIPDNLVIPEIFDEVYDEYVEAWAELRVASKRWDKVIYALTCKGYDYWFTYDKEGVGRYCRTKRKHECKCAECGKVLDD